MFKFDFIVGTAIIIYFATVITEIVSSVPVGLLQNDYGGECVLWASTVYNSTNETLCVTSYGKGSNCGYCTYLTIFTCIYAAGYGAYAAYAIYISVDNGAQMWVVPAMMVSTIFFILKFISSVILSIGFSELCKEITSSLGAKKTCTDGVTTKWCYEGNEVTGTHYYQYLTTAQSASWFCVFEWFLLVGLSILHYRRNISIRSSGTVNLDAGGVQNSDTAGVVENEVLPETSITNPNFTINENNFK